MNKTRDNSAERDDASLTTADINFQPETGGNDHLRVTLSPGAPADPLLCWAAAGFERCLEIPINPRVRRVENSHFSGSGWFRHYYGLQNWAKIGDYIG